MVEQYSLTRAKATFRMGFITWVLGLGTILSFNYLSEYKFLGMTFFNLLDNFTSKVMLPLGGLLMAVFVVFIVKRSIVEEELKLNTIIFNSWRLIIRFIAPIAVTLIFINGLI